MDTFTIICDEEEYASRGSCDGEGECTDGDRVIAFFTNDTECKLDYFTNNTFIISIDVGRSEEVETSIGTDWVAKGTSNQVMDSFVIICDEEEYPSRGSCDGDGEEEGDICQGVLEWSSNVYYYIGDKVTYYGNLFVMTNNGWKYLGACGDPNNPCYGVSEWSSNVYYYIGDRVTYQGSLYEKTNNGWKYIDSCETDVQINLCDGVSDWSSGLDYRIGDRVTYQGILYESTNNGGWNNLGSCGVEMPSAMPSLNSNISDGLSITI